MLGRLLRTGDPRTPFEKKMLGWYRDPEARWTTSWAAEDGDDGRAVLDAVEELSSGEFKASVLGAYERGERAISVPRLARLALIYEAPVDQLLPEPGETDGAPPANRGGSGEKVAVDLSRLAELDGPNFEMLARYLKMIQHARGDFNGKVLSLRHDDLKALCVLCGGDIPTGVAQLRAWGVLLEGPEVTEPPPDFAARPARRGIDRTS